MKYLLQALLLLIFFSCLSPKQEEKEAKSIYEVSDFVPDSVFTSGVEGPATDKAGNVYAVNFAEQGTIGIINPKGKSELFVKLPEGSIGNGIRLNAEGNLFIADYTKHNVLEIDKGTREVRVYAHDSTMNQPNDLAIMDNGILFASDPKWSESTGNLWRIDRDGSTHLLESNMGTTNGVEVSPDQKTLYVNESVQLNVWAYDLDQEGNISNKRPFYKFDDFGLDGMRCDAEGNLYITRHSKGTVLILTPSGNILREVQLKGKKPTNIAFGGDDGKTCYVTMMDRGNVETFRAEHPGRAWAMLQK